MSDSKNVDPIKIEQAFSVLMSRAAYSQKLGMTYDDNRDLYEACGYTKDLQYEHFYNMFRRGPLGKIIIEKVPNSVWRNIPDVFDTNDIEVPDPFKDRWTELSQRLKIFPKLNRVDRLAGIGNYAVLLLGLNDTQDFSKPVRVTDSLDLVYLQAYAQDKAKISQFETNVNNPRYGKPNLYELMPTMIEGMATDLKSIIVHHSRVLHVVLDPIENEVFGTPKLEIIYNRLEDLQKIVAGSGEMFWRGARPGYAAKADADAKFGSAEAAGMQDQFDEYENHLRRWLTVQGVDIQSLAPQVVSPAEHVDVQLTLISSETCIPKRILIGSERGELASSQDERAWENLIYETMVNYAEPMVLRPLIDRLIEYKIMPTPSDGDYTVKWPRVSVLNEKDQAEIGRIRTDSFLKYISAEGGMKIIPPEVYLSEFLNFSKEDIEETLKVIESGSKFPEVINPNTKGTYTRDDGILDGENNPYGDTIPK